MVEAIGRQLDRCDICGKKVHKKDLVLTNVDFMSPSGSNYFPYSSINAGGWTIGTGTDAGVISTGPYCDRARISISDDNTATEILGSQTITAGAGYGDYSGYISVNTDALDISAFTSFTMSFDFGFYQQETDVAPVTVFVYITNGDGSGTTLIRRIIRFKESGRFWCTANTADLTSTTLNSVKFYIGIGTYTGGEQMWIDRIQLEKDVSKMGTFIPTSGSSVDQVGTRSMTMQKVCGHCYEPLLSRTEQFNRRAEQRVDEPVTVWNQEF